MQEILTTVSGKEVYIAIPGTYNPSIEYEVTEGIVGSGREARSYDDSDPVGVDFYAHQRDLALQAGHIFCVLSNGTDTWGTDAGASRLNDLYNYMQSNYNVKDKWTLWATSAGTTQLHRMVKEYPERVKAGLITFGVYDMLNVNTTGALVAWGASDNTQLATMIAGKNPPDYAAQLTDIPYLIYHGEDDTVVPVEINSIAFRDTVNGLGGNVTLHVVTGGHSTSNWAVYDDEEILSFLNGPIINSPVITQQNNDINATTTTEWLIQGEIVRYFYNTDPISENPDPNDLTEMIDGTANFAGATGVHRFIAGVERDGVWYWSPIKTVTFDQNYSIVFPTGLEKNAEARAKQNGQLVVPTEVGTFYFNFVDPSDPRASAIRVNTGTLETPQIVAVER